MNTKENFLAAIHFQSPERVPLGNEPIYHSFQFEGNFQIADWTDHWGVGWEVGLADTVPFPKGNPLPSLDRLSDYRIPDPNDLLLTPEMQDALKKVDRGQQLIKGELTYLLFERAWAIMGMENFMLALVTHPDEMHTFLHSVAHYARQVFERYLELGVDAIGFSEDLGSQRALMVSPAMFRKFILPEYVYCFEPVLHAGKIVHFHSCGCVQSVASDLASIGVTILNPIQARANDLQRIKTETTGRMALHGGIDTAVLALGTPDDVRSEVRRVMDILKPGGGYICAPDQDIPGIPTANLQALWQTAYECGCY
jgi:uroporphyrinogen decarboxylase